MSTIINVNSGAGAKDPVLDGVEVTEVVDFLHDVVVELRREPMSDYFVVSCGPNTSEQVLGIDIMDWLVRRMVRPYKLDLVEKAIDYCWNFGSADLSVKQFRRYRKTGAGIPDL